MDWFIIIFKKGFLEMKYFIFLVVVIVSWFSGPAFALQVCGEAKIGKAAVYANGRIKPFVVHALDRMMFVTDDKKEVSKNGVKNYCQLSFGDKTRVLQEIKVKIYHNEIKKVLGFDHLSKNVYLTIYEFLNQREAFINLARRTDDKRLVTILDVYLEKMATLEKILDGQDFKILIDNQWVYPLESPTLDQVVTYLTGKNNNQSMHVTFEYYNLLCRPFLISMVVLLIAVVVFGVGKNYRMVILISFISLLVQLLSMIVRGWVSKRIPLSNMYETVMLAGFVANILGILFYYRWKEKLVLISGLFLNIFTLFMLEFFTGMLDASINPLMPVLKNNFWLGVHVFTVMVAYAAFAFSWLISNFFICRDLYKERNLDTTNRFLHIISDALNIGVVFLSAGILTGGMWADFAWGRFWGWDPKEVWSLIVLLVYMIILHGRYTNWINQTKFIFLTAPAFLTVMMAWFGVNYVLATGLHSYGFSQGGTLFFFLFVSAQLMLSVFHLVKSHFSFR
ncbi:MAG: hypothetical protein A2381_15970 [Bdellovibrionales bacterium RIFOXYB1_FULL_37_110]|nr:MAG: hypothetical protein A2417_07820 [Bdellovibrionales bacterium RIFOXYC1_FULL_37_79]OFZ57111.1 MAG: hypothetical protein A2381_15970 [Bdellovibrionales bacterium RIFOXYB1_FULL_37_110]OFZ65405.1 MAG: hypothetical protein A2577_03900 [Bdellovibrionales bacterium RIFOXYD1_FULL_36_51]